MGAASVFRGNTRKGFCKGLAGAGRRIAEEAAHLHQQSNGAPLTWQIGKSACVTIMDAAGGMMTTGQGISGRVDVMNKVRAWSSMRTSSTSR